MKNPFLPFIFCLTIFLGCEKEEIALPQEAYHATENVDKAWNDCSFAEQTNQVHIVEFCGTDFFFHVSLRLSNQGNFHRIQAYAKCYKRGGDPANFIDFGKIEVEVDGKVHVWCDIPLDVQVPSDYNKDLENGQVPFRNQCEDCGINVVTLDYYKNISMILNQDFLKANFRLKLEGCGEHVEKFITLEI